MTDAPVSRFFDLSYDEIRGRTPRVVRINRAFFTDVFHPQIAAGFGFGLERPRFSGSHRPQSTLLLLPVQEHLSSRQDLIS